MFILQKIFHKEFPFLFQDWCFCTQPLAKNGKMQFLGRPWALHRCNNFPPSHFFFFWGRIYWVWSLFFPGSKGNLKVWKNNVSQANHHEKWWRALQKKQFHHAVTSKAARNCHSLPLWTLNYFTVCQCYFLITYSSPFLTWKSCLKMRIPPQSL